MADTTTLVRVTAPHFTAGLVMDARGIVIKAAPILAWAIGKPRDYLRADFIKRGWKAEIVKELAPVEMGTENAS